MKNKILRIIGLAVTVGLFAACTGNQTQQTCQLTSPNGNVVITFSLKDGQPFYSVQKGAEAIIKPSRLGFLLSGGDSLGINMRIVRTSTASMDESWGQPWGQEDSVRNHYNELKIELQEKNGKQRLLNIVFRAFDDGLGFRYEFPKQGNLKKFEIADELTEFALPDDYQGWSFPAYKTEYYEGLYRKSLVSRMDTVPTPLTIERSGGKFLTIHEANLTDYASLNLYPVAETSILRTDLTPWSTGIKVYAETPFVSPWRTLIIANNLNELANSRIMLNLNEPSKIEDVSWIHPSKYTGIWWGMHKEFYTWAQGPKHGATTENAKAYIDFTAAHHIPAVLVEGWNYGWDGDWVADGDKFSFTKNYPDYDIEEVVRYAASKGVKIIAHNETGGATINYENQLDSAFALYSRLGINTVKTGYVNPFLDHKEQHGSQYGVRHYRKVIETAAKYNLMIDNHEPAMPTGLQRTYPNFMTQEGVRGQEYDAWSGDGGNPPDHTTIIPFTRGLAGPMDYTPGAFNFTANPAHPHTRTQSTIAKQLALYVVLYSPLQMISDMPENYVNKPAFEFLELVPTDWSKTFILDGKIGDFVVTARKDRHSGNWYVGAITNENSRNLTLNLSFLEKGQKYMAKIFRDAPDADWKTNPYPVVIEEREVTADSTIDLYLASGGGAAIQLKNVSSI